MDQSNKICNDILRDNYERILQEEVKHTFLVEIKHLAHGTQLFRFHLGGFVKFGFVLSRPDGPFVAAELLDVALHVAVEAQLLIGHKDQVNIAL